MKDFMNIFIIYILVLVLFYNIDDNLSRFLLTTILYINSLLLFKVKYSMGILYLLLAIGASFTEFIFIKYMKNSWEYKNPDITLIPNWLIPLWGIAIIIIIQISNKFNNKDMFLYKLI